MSFLGEKTTSFAVVIERVDNVVSRMATKDLGDDLDAINGRLATVCTEP